jgi:hypothetical protein
MNHTVTAAVALAAGLGMAGLAHAQMSNYQTPGKADAGQQMAPSPAISPAMPGNYQTPGKSDLGQAPIQPGPQTNMQGSQQPDQQMGMQGMPSHEHGMMRHARSNVAEAQKELKSQGFYNGRIDGIAGPETKSALSDFQQKNGLHKSAMLDRETRDRLKQADTGSGSQAQPTPNQTQTPASTTPGGTSKP